MMIVKKFEASSMKEALEKIKADMGPEAFILQTRSVKRKGPLGFGERTFLEVTAAIDKPSEAQAKAENQRVDLLQDSEDSLTAAKKETPVAQMAHAPAVYDARGTRPFNQGFDAVFQESKQAARDLSRKRPAAASSSQGRPLREELLELRNLVEEFRGREVSVAPLQQELKELKNLLYTVVQGQHRLPTKVSFPALIQAHRRLEENGIHQALSAKLIQICDEKLSKKEKGSFDVVWRFIRSLILKSVDVAGDLTANGTPGKVIAFVGPTGVGKTTTLAKLAAVYGLQRQLNVAMITLDTYRISAVDQLKTYAQIMDIPLQVALNVTELWQAVQFHQDKDLILIDTAGHSQNDVDSMKAIHNFFSGRSDIEIHLLLSATTKSEDLTDIVEKFSALKPRHLIFTKLDETRSYGALFTQLVKTKKPVSFVTVGQSVPEDLAFATKELLADLFMGKGYVRERSGT